jgi:alpha-L-rhamnosidase
LPTDEPPSAATIEITADDQFDLFVNGQKAGKGEGWGSPQTIALDAFLKPGKNVLAVEARNVGNNPNPAGLLAKLKVAFARGSPLTLTTGEHWKSATNVQTGWNALLFDDTAWVDAKLLGEYGTQSWGIIQSEDRRLAARYLRRTFAVKKKIQRATAYVCGLGLFELYLNGRKVSNDVLSPALSEYDKRAFYLTFDLTDQLKRGDNAVGVMLGNGRFFAPRSSVPIGMRNFGYPKLLLQINVEYTDGTTSQIVSDGNWKLTTDGPIRANNEYDGEEYDARMEMRGWCQPAFASLR